jgi:hypothetical protein
MEARERLVTAQLYKQIKKVYQHGWQIWFSVIACPRNQIDQKNPSKFIDLLGAVILRARRNKSHLNKIKDLAIGFKSPAASYSLHQDYQGRPGVI